MKTQNQTITKTHFLSLIIGLVLTSLFVYFTFLTPESVEERASPIDKYELLHASDVQKRVKQAVKNNQLDALNDIQLDIVDIAKQMGFNQTDMAFLSGSQAYGYLVFQAKRSLFDEAVETSYRQLTSIEQAKRLFPEAGDKFDHADDVIAQRDKLFTELVETLKGQGLNKPEALQQAKTLWISRFESADMQDILR